MPIDSETKRRSALGMLVMALAVAPVPDGTVAAVDREHILGIYAGIAPVSPGVDTTAIHILSTGKVEPEHASDSKNNLLLAGDMEVQGTLWAGGASNYSKIDSGGDISLVGTAKVVTDMPFANAKFPVIDKASGNGIKVDTTTPTFGWRDLLGDVFARNTGASKPFFTTYRDSLLDYQFAAGDEEYFKFHIPHDYVKGTNIFIHIHWSHTGSSVTGGTITFTIESTYSKGHNQAIFPASVSGTYNGTASTIQYQHIFSETQLSDSSPTGLQLDTDDLEPDGIIIMRMEMTANNITVSGGGVPDPFIHYVDIHYQSTNISTKDKVPDFYT